MPAGKGYDTPAKRRKADKERAKLTGKGAARKAAESTIKQKARNRSALDAAQRAFNAARRS